MDASVESSSPIRAWLCAGLILVGAIAFIAVPVWQLIVPGPFEWHIRQPAFWQGGLEALLLAALIAGGFALNRRGWLAVLAGVPALLYLRRHAVDVPLLVDIVYFEIVIGLGMAARRFLRLPLARNGEDYLQAFVLGFLVWSIAAWSLSAFDSGSIKMLRWLTVLLVLPALAGRTAPLALHAWRRMREQDAPARTWCGVLAAWILVLFARTNVVVGYDPLWYGLRPEYVLDPGRSVFEPLGLVSPVYYFPKLFEVFLLPVSASGDFSVIDGMTILLLIPILLACRGLMQRIVVPTPAQWPVLALIATLPALANSAISPKPDVIATLFVLLAALGALDAAGRRSISAWVWLLACALLACLAKLTAIPYVGALMLATGFSAWRARHASNNICAIETYPRPLAATALAAACIVAAFVTARTWLLTGMPTIGPDPLFRLWKSLGMSLHEPAGTIHWVYSVKWEETPAVVFDVLFRPWHNLLHMIITWVGNVWLWLTLIAGTTAVLWRTSQRHVVSRLPLGALIAAGLYLFFGVGYNTRGSDGNYFLYGVVPAIIVSAGATFARLESRPRLFALALACLPAFVLFHASYSFVSASWGVGTRSFDVVLNRNWHDTRKLRRASLEASGLTKIAQYLKKRRPSAPRVVGYAIESGPWLPARYESINQIGYARPHYVGSAAEFRQFLANQHIDYLILPLPATAREVDKIVVVPAGIAEAAMQLSLLPGTQRIEDRRYYMLDLSDVQSSAVDVSTR